MPGLGSPPRARHEVESCERATLDTERRSRDSSTRAAASREPPLSAYGQKRRACAQTSRPTTTCNRRNYAACVFARLPACRAGVQPFVDLLERETETRFRPRAEPPCAEQSGVLVDPVTPDAQIGRDRLGIDESSRDSARFLLAARLHGPGWRGAVLAPAHGICAANGDTRRGQRANLFRFVV
jgi:hypothetical protein